ncbi:MAG: hypothetical protein ACFNWT_06685, partial [Prevotella denticola]
SASVKAVWRWRLVSSMASWSAMMIEPTESESKDTIDGFIKTMHIIAREARETPELVKEAPHSTPIGRVDDVLAAKHPVLTYRQLVNEKAEEG